MFGIKKRLSAIIAIVIASILLINIPLFADNAGLTESDHQVVVQPKLTADEMKIIKAKEKAMEDVAEIIKRHVTDKNQSENEGALRKELNEFGLTEILLPEYIVSPQTMYERILGVTAYGQETDYYCGPASLFQLLKYKNINRNPNDNRSTTQANLANDLNTSEDDGTDFTGTWISTLNDWTGKQWYAKWSPDGDQILDYTMTAVTSNWPVIYDCYMNSSRGYLPGYTSGTTYHYVTGDGWRFNDGYPNDKFVHYVDPNRYRSSAYGPHFINVFDLERLLKNYGMLY